jgi:hypothetical protein
MKFKAGDKVWVRCGNLEFKLFGTKPGVVVGPDTFKDAELFGFPPNEQWYRVDLLEHQHPVAGAWLSSERHMWPRDEDGRQVGSWAHGELTWKPPGTGNRTITIRDKEKAT